MDPRLLNTFLFLQEGNSGRLTFLQGLLFKRFSVRLARSSCCCLGFAGLFFLAVPHLFGVASHRARKNIQANNPDKPRPQTNSKLAKRKQQRTTLQTLKPLVLKTLTECYSFFQHSFELFFGSGRCNHCFPLESSTLSWECETVPK